MKQQIVLACALAALVMTRSSGADTVEMRDGKILTGKYGGGTAGTIRLEAPEGVMVLETSRVLAVTFTDVAAAPATPAAPAPAATPAPAAASVAPAAAAPAAVPMAAAAPATVPAGTVLTIRVETPVSSNNPPGTKFTAKLLADLMAGNVTVAKAGTPIYGEVDQSAKAGRLVGKSKLSHTLTAIDLGGKMQPIMTTDFAEAGFALGDTRVAWIRRYASDEQAGKLDNAQATEIAKAYFDFQRKQTDLLKKYHDQIAERLSQVRAAQFTQIGHRLGIIIDLMIVVELPLIETAHAAR
jgi:hypothetical protein